MRIFGGNVCASRNQQPYDLRVTCHSRSMQGRVPIAWADCFNCCATGEKNGSDAGKACGCSDMQRCVASSVSRADIGALVQQQFGNLRVLPKRQARVKRRHTHVIRRFGVARVNVRDFVAHDAFVVTR